MEHATPPEASRDRGHFPIQHREGHLESEADDHGSRQDHSGGSFTRADASRRQVLAPQCGAQGLAGDVPHAYARDLRVYHEVNAC